MKRRWGLSPGTGQCLEEREIKKNQPRSLRSSSLSGRKKNKRAWYTRSLVRDMEAVTSCGRSCPQDQRVKAQELTVGFGNMKVRWLSWSGTCGKGSVFVLDGRYCDIFLSWWNDPQEKGSWLLKYWKDLPSSSSIMVQLLRVTVQAGSDVWLDGGDRSRVHLFLWSTVSHNAHKICTYSPS